MNASTRTLRVFVAGWVIQDGSFPIAAVGDLADVSLEQYPSDVPSPCDERRTATAVPAYGTAPRQFPDGGLRWLHLVYGDGWSSQWWADRATHGPVTLTGTFSATLPHFGLDAPPRCRGRIRRMHLVDRRVRAEGNGWSAVPGSDRLTDITAVPLGDIWWPSEATADGDFIPTGVLVELDLDDVPPVAVPFIAGALAVDGDTVWILHSWEPVLLRVDHAHTVPVITRYALPLTIEPPIDRWARPIHAQGDGGWITSEHDIHRFTALPDGELTIDRYATDGGGTSAVHEGRLYLLGSTRSHLSDDRRHGLIRTYPDAQRSRMLDESNRRIVPVDGPAPVRATRADRATGADGTQWCVDGANTLRRLDSDGVATSSIDLSDASKTGSVRSITPDPFTDPANADVVAAITLDVSRFRRTSD